MKTALATAAAAGLAIVLVIQQWRLSQQLKDLSQEQQALREQQQQTAASLETTTAQLQRVRAAQGTGAAGGDSAALLQKNQARVAELEKQVHALNDSLARRGFASPPTPAVPEYDPTQPPPPEPAVETPTNSAPRSWSAEQVIGPPDTGSAGDHGTAWASREPDAGPEWLSVGFARPLDMAEVRIRESFNPGAIVKVAALVNNQEIVLWEGQAARGQSLRDFVVRPTLNVQAQNVTIHLDTASVPGWNEIDAVELVGRDGSRQWAAAVSASSSYADRMGGGAEPFLLQPRLR
jgi:hypothetical protein